MAALLQRDGPWDDAITRHTAAAAAAQELGDQPCRADALYERRVALRLDGRPREATRALEEALDIYRVLGDQFQLGQVDTLNELGVVRPLTGLYEEAASALTEAARSAPASTAGRGR
jgi:tetratricopeptide (TPR) repeat protein